MKLLKSNGFWQDVRNHGLSYHCHIYAHTEYCTKRLHRARKQSQVFTCWKKRIETRSKVIPVNRNCDNAKTNVNTSTNKTTPVTWLNSIKQIEGAPRFFFVRLKVVTLTLIHINLSVYLSIHPSIHSSIHPPSDSTPKHSCVYLYREDHKQENVWLRK